MNTVLTARPKLPAEADALEARFALRLTAQLEAGAQTLPHDISERLRVARQQALAQARQSAAARRPEAATTSSITIVSIDPRSGAATMGRLGGGESPWWGRLGWLVPALALTLGLLGLGEWESQEQIQRAAQIDTELLGGDLPPAAYLDDGFGEFLRRPPEVLMPASVEEPASVLASAGT